MSTPQGEPQGNGDGSGQTPPPTPPPTPPTPPTPPPTGGDNGQGGDTGGDRRLTQAEVDAIVRDRLARERAKFADYDDLKKRAADADRLRQEKETETEKAIREAREAALAEANASVRPQLVAAEFRAAAAGRIPADRLPVLTEDLDFSRYLTDTGAVDTEKVKAKIDAWAPAPSGEQEPEQPQRVPGPRPDRTQGREGSGKPSGLKAGASMYEASRGRGRGTGTQST